MDDLSRFWLKVDLLGDCWEWLGTRTPAGYGSFFLAGKTRMAHRISYQWANGPIPPHTDICHRCDNPPCVRPEHLFAGSRRDNMQDAKAKGRIASGDGHWSRLRPERVPRGERRGSAKLSNMQVEEIRRLYQPGVRGSQIALARQFSVSPAQVCRILNGIQRTA